MFRNQFWMKASLSLLLITHASCGKEPEAPRLFSVSPTSIKGNTEVSIIISGQDFDQTSQWSIDGQTRTYTSVDADTLTGLTPRLARGSYPIQVTTQYGTSNPVTLQVENSVPTIYDPGPQLLEGGKLLEIKILASDFDGDTLKLNLSEKPKTAEWDENNNTLRWNTAPEDADQTYPITVVATDNEATTELTFFVEVVLTVPPFELEAVTPTMYRGNEAFELTVTGKNFTNGDTIYWNGQALTTTVNSSVKLTAQVPPQKRGAYEIQVRRLETTSPTKSLYITNSIPVIAPVKPIEISEEEVFSQQLTASDFDGDELSIYALKLPPGAQYNVQTQTLQFTPDFIQGRQTYEVVVLATDGQDSQTSTITLNVTDTITPPWPTITSTEVRSDHIRLRLTQDTDDYLESPSEAGRTYLARVVVPTAATESNQLPVRVYLHGFGGAPYNGGAGDQFRIYPADPDNTYWWGHTNGTAAPNYTQRRVLHLVEWLLANYPSADPNRVYVTGPSMGGAGAAELGLLYARHFSHVESTIGQMVARNHRPARVRQLSGLWGTPEENFDSGNGIGVWDRQDLTRALRDEYDAQNQFIYTKHGKDDPTIHFGAVTHSSPQTMFSFYEAVQEYQIGHFIVWDEGGHGSADPELGNNWWSDGWSRSLDETTFLKNNLAFPAFTNSSSDNDPGDGNGNGRQTWNDTRGYAGTVATPDDTGWNGELAGTFNRYFRWDSRAIVDTWNRFQIPIRVKIDTNGTPSNTMYPPSGDKYFGALPITADVTIRRTQAFRCKPQTPVTWSYGKQSGIIRADDRGVLTILSLQISQDFETLTLVRTEN